MKLTDNAKTKAVFIKLARVLGYQFEELSRQEEFNKNLTYDVISEVIGDGPFVHYSIQIELAVLLGLHGNWEDAVTVLIAIDRLRAMEASVACRSEHRWKLRAIDGTLV